MLAALSLSAKIEFKQEEGRNLVAVIDAGSSGSRLYIFQYRDNPGPTQNRVIEITNHKVEPGISTFGSNPSALNQYFSELISGTKTKLASYNASNNARLSLDGMPVYLLATAGMRNISENDRNKILGAVKSALEKSELSFKDAQTIRGLDEAIYAWTAANFNSPTNQPLGIVEIGGASTQVVFPFSGSNPHAVTINLRGKDYKLYAYSYPKNGENESINRIKSFDKVKFDAVCETMTGAKRKASTFNECVNLIVDSFKIDCNNKTTCKSGWTNEAVQPNIESATPFTVAGMIRAAKNDFVNTKSSQIPLTQGALKEAGSFACQMTTNDIVAQKAIKDPRFASKACFQSALSYAMLYGNAGIVNAKEPFKGVGLPSTVSLVDSPAPGPEWSIGFVLFQEADGRFK